MGAQALQQEIVPEYEAGAIPVPAPVKSWRYRTYEQAPKLHKRILDALIAGHTEHEIARAFGVDVPLIQSIEVHPPMADYLLEAHVNQMEWMSKLHKTQDLMVDTGHNVLLQIMNDPEAANKDRIAAVKVAFDSHHSGQFCRQNRVNIPEEQRSITFEVIKQRAKLAAIEANQRLIAEAGVSQ